SAKGDDKFITTDYLQQCPAPICTETKDKNAAANAMPCLEFVSIIIFTALGMIEILILYNQYISSIFHGKTIK
ncbi:hypothetical protein, partial [Acinetobacter baumannii]